MLFVSLLSQLAITLSGPVAKEIAKNQPGEPVGKNSANKGKKKDPKEKEVILLK